VVAFSKSDESRDNMVTGRVAVIEWLITKPMSQRVDAESGLLDEEDAEDAAVDEATPPIIPAESAEDCWEDETHEHDDLEVVLVLPDDHRVFVEIGDVGTANSLWVLLHQHPTEVGVEEAFADGVWVFVGVGVSMMGAVVTSPPTDRTLDCSTTNGSEEDTERECGGVRCMCPHCARSISGSPKGQGFCSHR